MGTKIFISSVSKHLEEIRQQVAFSLKELGHDPVYFESRDFAKSNNSLMVQTCLENVEESQVFLLMIGRETGSFDELDGRSITHLELTKAIASNKTIIVFVEDYLKQVYFGDYLRIYSKTKELTELEQANEQAIRERVYLEMGDRDIQRAVFEILADAHNHVPWLHGFISSSDVIETIKQELSNMLSSYINLKNQKQIQSLDKIVENSYRIDQYDKFLKDIFPFLKNYNESQLDEVLNVAQSRLKGGILYKEDGFWINKKISRVSTCVGISIYRYNSDKKAMVRIARSGIARGKEEYDLEDEISFVSLVYKGSQTDSEKTGELFSEEEKLYHSQVIDEFVLTLHFMIEELYVPESEVNQYVPEIFGGIMELQANSEILSVLSFFLEGRDE